MDCNKEEAERAKKMAEGKMETKQFMEARKIALRAQRLYPQLENILQLLTVCDVHCAATEKMMGSEMDWYGILQIEQTSDDILVKKQYRKLALLLHPDKNKFAGAEAAFKLIGEAQRILLDPAKKSLHNMKRRAHKKPSAQSHPPQQASMNTNLGKQPGPWVKNIYANYSTSQYASVNLQHQQPQRQTVQSSSSEPGTFRTLCPTCGTEYHFFISSRNKTLFCNGCMRPFLARDKNDQNVTIGAHGSKPAFPQKTEIPKQGIPRAGKQSNSSIPGYSVKFQADPSGENRPTKKTRCDSDVEKKSAENGISKAVNDRKRKKDVEESSESVDSESSYETEEDVDYECSGIRTGEGFGISGEQNPRRSTRQKRNVSYGEKGSDTDEGETPLQEGNESGAPEKRGHDVSVSAQLSGMKRDKDVIQEKMAASVELPFNGNNGTEKAPGIQIGNYDDKKRNVQANNHSKSSSSSEAQSVPEVFDCPDPEFSDFEKDRQVSCFKPEQMWAVYDMIDAMPRFYAIIKKVFSSSTFKVRIMWLEPDCVRDSEDERHWLEEGLPASCGKFRNGSTEEAEDLPMFSHRISWAKGRKKGTYEIYPQRGEIWALFKNWDIKWKSDSEPNQKLKFEFEFVEVLSEYTDDVGVHVAYLEKVKGFTSLFRRVAKDENSTCYISPKELLKFSHSVPSFKMTGQEREGVPQGSFELDPACLPNNLIGPDKF